MNAKMSYFYVSLCQNIVKKGYPIWNDWFCKIETKIILKNNS